jgi:hypothetical protein
LNINRLRAALWSAGYGTSTVAKQVAAHEWNCNSAKEGSVEPSGNSQVDSSHLYGNMLSKQLFRVLPKSNKIPETELNSNHFQTPLLL